ncbi:MAG: S-layer homology domain-containing protein [Clostridiales Family XIII bacterium]|jgi:heat shock protein HspQ|nr:S-layer homology domain-containing protein [Clostridiales Family XIII bacterium]
MKKKAISFVLATVLAFAVGAFTASPAFAASPFDISGHWAEGHVLAGINYGYIRGYEDGSFKPENTITRAEFVTIINNARHYTAMTNIPFRDVPVNEWYFQEVQRAYSAGYIQGDSVGNFNPNAQITRQEAAVILDRIAPGGDTAYALTGVRDADKIDAWALSAVRAVYSRAYIQGDADGNFNPTAPLKRCEAVAIVNRILNLSPLQPSADLAALSISNINVTDVKADSATLSLTATRDGSVYWVVLTGENATTPTAEQILAGRTADNQGAYGAGSRSVYANNAITASVPSLQSEQSYKICAVVRDATGNLSAVAIRSFSTSTEGGTGEEWLSNFTESNIDNNALTLTVTSSRAGTLYYVVVEDPNRTVKTPSQAYIKSGRDANNSSTNVISGNFSVASGVSKPVEVTGLKSGTNYKIFGCVYESSNNSLYSTVKSRTFTTAGTLVDWITDFSVSSAGTTSATLNMRANRTGEFYYVVTENATQPTLTRIRNGRDYSNNAAVLSGHPNISSANTYAYQSLSNLTAGRTYYVFGVLYANGEWSEIETRSFNTGAATAAEITVSYSLSTATTPGSISFSNSGSSYTATAELNLTGNNSGAHVTISVGKSNNASSVTAVLTPASGGSSGSSTEYTNNTSFYIDNSLLGTGSNRFTLTVAESGRNKLTYTLYIKK